MKILVTGGNFNNKGAQTMLFVTMSELAARYPGAELYYTALKAPKGDGRFRFRHLYKSVFLAAFGQMAGNASFFDFHYSAMETAVRRVNQHCSLKQIGEYKKLLQGLDLIVDISGYTLSSRFASGAIPGKIRFYRQTTQFLNMIDAAKKLNIPVILMPQSFGPFDYGKYTEELTKRIAGTLAWPKLIFAREAYAYDLLTKDLGLTNVVRSDDLVLQYTQIHWELIADRIDMSAPKIPTEHNVAVIPNEKVKEQVGDPEKFYRLYRQMIAEIQKKGKHVWLIWHSGEDKKICEEIMRRNRDVQMVDQELAFYQYEQVIPSFDYAVASRFHSIVHAFRHGVPCISFGWAEKYDSLFSSCGQEAYAVNCREAAEHPEKMIACIDQMEENWQRESGVILAGVQRMQQHNCFEQMFSVLDELKIGD